MAQEYRSYLFESNPVVGIKEQGKDCAARDCVWGRIVWGRPPRPSSEAKRARFRQKRIGSRRIGCAEGGSEAAAVLLEAEGGARFRGQEGPRHTVKVGAANITPNHCQLNRRLAA
jgi:hypothetical protein